MATTFIIGRKGVCDSVDIGTRTERLGVPNRETNPGFSGLKSVLKPSMYQRHDSMGARGSPPRLSSQSAPSVTFSDLDTFANPDRVLPQDQHNNDMMDSMPKQDYYSDEDDDEELLRSGPNHNTYFPREYQQDLHVPDPIHTASSAQPDQHFKSDDKPTRRGNYNPWVEPTDTHAERVRLIAKLKRRNARRKAEDQEIINPDADIHDLRIQAAGASYETQAKTAVLMLRRVTVFITKIIEALSARYPEYIPELEGWSENVYLSLDSYDEMLYDIYDEYGHKVKTNPLITFIFALGSNAAMFAMTKKIMNNPVAGQVINSLAQHLANQPPSSIPVGTGKPAVPVSTSSTREMMEEPVGLNGLASMFGDEDMSKLLGGLDMNKILSGIGDLMGPTIRTGDVLSDKPKEVRPMKPMSNSNQQEVFDLMRNFQDQAVQGDRGLHPIKESNEEPKTHLMEISRAEDSDEKRVVFS